MTTGAADRQILRLRPEIPKTVKDPKEIKRATQREIGCIMYGHQEGKTGGGRLGVPTRWWARAKRGTERSL
jgi:hypothetical protein